MKTSETLAAHLNLPADIISGFKEIYYTLKGSALLKERLGIIETTKTLETSNEQDRLENKLKIDHSYSYSYSYSLASATST